MDNIAIGNRLLKLRTQRGLTQIQVAEMLGVSNKAVSKWECGEALPSVDMLVALSRLYGVSIDEILLNEDKKESLKEPPPPSKGKGPEAAVVVLAAVALFGAILSVLLAYLLAFLDNLAAALWGGLIPLLLAVVLLILLRFLFPSKGSTPLEKAASISAAVASFANFFVVYAAILVGSQFPFPLSSVHLTGLGMAFLSVLAIVPSIPLAIGIAKEDIEKCLGIFSSLSALVVAALLIVSALEASNDWVIATVAAVMALLPAGAGVATIVIGKWHFLDAALSLVASIVVVAIHPDYASFLSTAYSSLILAVAIFLAIKRRKRQIVQASNLNE